VTTDGRKQWMKEKRQEYSTRVDAGQSNRTVGNCVRNVTGRIKTGTGRI